jgi:hypothetical protein
MSRKAKRWITGIITAATTAVLILLPTAAQAGVVVTGVD